MDDTTPVGDPSCNVCKDCSQYKTCFSGMEGFPKTSSNFGKPQHDCAKHERECGLNHRPQKTILEFLEGS